MATKAQAQKDREMASRLKKDNDKREIGRCPICNKVVAYQQLQNHIAFHPA